MNAKRIAALMLSIVLTLSLVVLPASAVTFTDMTGHWAREDVEYLANQGVVKGTSATTFAPDQKMTACEALLFCSRTTGVSSTDKLKIATAWAPKLKEILPDELYSWAAEEMAVCLETGILSETELRAMSSSGALVRTISRENLSMYLVRAMQLEPLVRSLSSYPMSFADATAISSSLQPYVYLLSMYGIVKGDQSNRFNPQGSLTRAEMATMLRRAIDRMEDLGIYAELPGYTDYDWVGGTITSVSTGTSGVTLLTVNSELSGAHSVSLPADVKIYENNMLTTLSALKTGQYARVNLSSGGVAQSVRLGGALTTYEGTITSLDQTGLTMTVNGSAKSLEIDRFTEVQVRQSVGDSSLIDPAAGYSQAVCYVDAMGHLAAVNLSGGTTGVEGILRSTSLTLDGQTLRVSGFDGVVRSYQLASGATVTVDGAAGTLTKSCEGRYVNLQVSNDDSTKLTGVAVDTKTVYVQGSIRSLGETRYRDTVTINDQATGKSETYDIDPNAVLRYEGETVGVNDLRRNTFVTVRLDSDQEVIFLDSYPGYTTVEGVLVSIAYGTPTVLTVRTRDGASQAYELDMEYLPNIYREDVTSSLDKLQVGDQIVLTLHYNQVETIESYAQQANVTGTISRVVQDSSGVTLDLTLPTGGTVSYKVQDNASVTQDGVSISLYSLKPNYQVSMVVSGETVLSIQVDKTSDSQKKLTGSVLVPDAWNQTLMIRLEDGSAVTVDVSKAMFLLGSGWTITLNDLDPGDAVEIYGSYSGAQFVATLVVSP